MRHWKALGFVLCAASLAFLTSCGGGGGGCESDFVATVRDLILNQTSERNDPMPVGDSGFCGDGLNDADGLFDDIVS